MLLPLQRTATPLQRGGFALSQLVHQLSQGSQCFLGLLGTTQLLRHLLGHAKLLVSDVAGHSRLGGSLLCSLLLEKIGLADVLGMLRSRGLRAIVGRVRRELIDVE